MRAELTVAYDSNADLRDRIHSLQQQVAAMRAEAAARTPVGVTIEKVRHMAKPAVAAFRCINYMLDLRHPGRMVVAIALGCTLSPHQVVSNGAITLSITLSSSCAHRPCPACRRSWSPPIREPLVPSQTAPTRVQPPTALPLWPLRWSA